MFCNLAGQTKLFPEIRHFWLPADNIRILTLKPLFKSPADTSSVAWRVKSRFLYSVNVITWGPSFVPPRKVLVKNYPASFFQLPTCFAVLCCQIYLFWATPVHTTLNFDVDQVSSSLLSENKIGHIMQPHLSADRHQCDAASDSRFLPS